MPDPHKPLRDDVSLLGELLGGTLRTHDPGLFERVERVRAFAKAAHGGDSTAFDRLRQALGEMPIELATPVARAFAHFLALANIAEQHHRTRRRREYAGADGRPQRGSCDEAFRRFIQAGIAPADLAAAVRSLHIELVLTAHPTEVVRRTLVQKYNRIAERLAFRDRSDLTPAEQEESLAAISREIETAWQTDDARDRTVTPIDEVRAGLAVFEQTIWDAAPAFLRTVDRALSATTGQSLPLQATPVRFGSWIGGDRDGNPNVTAEITRQATWLARWEAAHLYRLEVDALRDELSLGTASPDLVERAGDRHEPYRALLREVRERLIATRDFAKTQLDGAPDEQTEPGAPPPYLRADDLAQPLLLCYRSLEATGNHVVAGGRLTDLIRRVSTFGLVLAPLDLRQEAAKHAEAIDWILKTRGTFEYASASEDDRQQMLVRLLGGSPGTFDGLPLADASPVVRDVIETFRQAAALEAESLGAYVITMASRPSDVLAVEFLQTAAGSRRPQRVVPLFETADDLASAGETLRALFAVPWYCDRIRDASSGRGLQEVMIGYSDSAKDAGRFSAAWALYRAQEDIVSACADHRVGLTLFHGRGGSVGRGGGPTYLAIQSQPPGSVNGSLRVTEQGEMIQAKFGVHDIALRTLEVYTTATLEATLLPSAQPQPEWRAAMERLSDDGRQGYRAIVREHPQFLEYFRAATPELELRTLPIGSRPARRPSSGAGGVDSLRAIPWQFAWTQTRLLLASWLGVETALDRASARGEEGSLRTMYESWPFFRSTIDLMEMVLAKADRRIAALYDRELVPEPLQPLGHELRTRLDAAIAAVLRVAGHRQLVESNPVLRRSIDVRNPYVDPINLVQIELLRRMRGADAPDERLQRAFAVTVNGIAAGMRNTG